MSTATSGRAREHRVSKAMIDAGWSQVARSAASKGVADLIMVHPDHGLALVQVGTHASKRLGPEDRAKFLRMAGLCSALPVVALVRHGVGITYWQPTLGPFGEWSPWAP